MKMHNKIAAVALVVALALGLNEPMGANAATAVNLGTAGDFAVLANSTIVNTGSSVVNGNLGLSPGTSVTGFPPGTINGTQHVANATALQAKTDLTTAYTNAAGQAALSVPTELGGTVKTAGAYNSADGTFGITGTLTLDAQGDPNAVFIFKTVSTLITAGASTVVLANGAQACNVFWQVGSSATLGTTSTFKGNILALTSITLTTAANVEGRVLAREGAVTLDTNTITVATCAAVPTPYSGYSPPLATGPAPVPPLISVVKVPTPLALPAGPGSVVYDYTVINVGTVAMSNVTVTDNKCAPVGFVSGDSNGDLKLDVSETWKYRCAATLTQTTINTVTATGQANGFTAIDTANATVVVSVPLPPPLIHLVKKPNVFVLPAGGGAVTYTYIVTNPGTAPLNNVSVIDDKCTGLPGRVLGHPGDLNKNDLLESNETWTFTCQTNITETTVNTGTAEGGANGLTALDFSLATVVVSAPVVSAVSVVSSEVTAVKVTPKLPNTGVAPDEKSALWNFALPVGIFSGAVLLLVVRRKKVV